MKKHTIKARCDASFKKYEDVIYIGIGIAVEQRGGINFTKSMKHKVNGKVDVNYAELIGTIELLKTLQNIHYENISIIGDNDGVITNINKLLKCERNDKELYGGALYRMYPLECNFLLFLTMNIRANFNEIHFNWQARSNNRVCDELSKRRDEFEIEYTLSNGDIEIFRCKTTNELEAQSQCKKHISTRERELKIKQEKIAEKNNQIAIHKAEASIKQANIQREEKKPQSKTILNKMLKMFKRTGKAYA